MRDTGPALPPLRLRDEFPPVSAAEWEAQALHELADEAFEARLLWRLDEGLTVKPFFTRDDLAALPARPQTPGLAGHWQIATAASWSDTAIRADRVHEAGGTAVHELAWATAAIVDRWAATGATSRLDVVCAVGSRYFVEIAKLRALRRLSARVREVFDPAGGGASALCLHARTSRANKSGLDPNTNLLRVTTEAMAAVIGGADVVLVEPYGFAPHLAVNVQHLLADEAHLGATADPASGSYYIESLTEDLGAAAWRMFQEIEAAGGYAAALTDGLLAAHLAPPRQARQREVATRRRTLVGVNTYPDPAPPSAVPSPFTDEDAAGVVTPGGVAPLRLAQPFEDIRARTARHAGTIGRLPVVHLLTRGDPAAQSARAAFSRNLFGCGGFSITEGDHAVPGADLVVLCGADADYTAMVEEVAPSLAVPLVVAGRPDLLAGVLPGGRVDGYVHAGSDAVAVLSHWQDRLGMAP